MVDGPLEHERALMARIGWLYYFQGLTQQDIADRLGLSRVKVLRLLARARQEGIVQIRIDHPSLRFMELEEALRQRFGLQDAVVAPGGETAEQTLEAVGQFGAMFLERKLEPGDAIGTAWGVTLRRVARHLRPLSVADVTVVQLMGGLNAGGLTNPLDIARLVAEKLHGRLQMLYTPAFVDSPEIRDALLSDHRIAQTLRAGASVTKALVGVGDVTPGCSLAARRPAGAGRRVQNRCGHAVNICAAAAHKYTRRPTGARRGTDAERETPGHRRGGGFHPWRRW